MKRSKVHSTLLRSIYILFRCVFPHHKNTSKNIYSSCDAQRHFNVDSLTRVLRTHIQKMNSREQTKQTAPYFSFVEQKTTKP